jgi:HSP20 family molecular chaperone IbpA
MKSRIFWLALIMTAAILLFSATALGWTPYGYGPAEGFGPPWPTSNQGLGGWQTPQPVQRMRIERAADQDNYYLTIRVSGMEPQAVAVSVEGDRWLAIRRQDSRESSYENTAEDGSAYYRGFSYSSGSTSRRISLPRDADVAALQREDGEGQIRIVIPRKR